MQTFYTPSEIARRSAAELTSLRRCFEQAAAGQTRFSARHRALTAVLTEIARALTGKPPAP